MELIAGQAAVLACGGATVIDSPVRHSVQSHLQERLLAQALLWSCAIRITGVPDLFSKHTKLPQLARDEFTLRKACLKLGEILKTRCLSPQTHPKGHCNHHVTARLCAQTDRFPFRTQMVSSCREETKNSYVRVEEGQCTALMCQRFLRHIWARVLALCGGSAFYFVIVTVS